MRPTIVNPISYRSRGGVAAAIKGWVCRRASGPHRAPGGRQPELFMAAALRAPGPPPYRLLLAEKLLRPVQPRQHECGRAKDRKEDGQHHRGARHLLGRRLETQVLL